MLLVSIFSKRTYPELIKFGRLLDNKLEGRLYSNIYYSKRFLSKSPNYNMRFVQFLRKNDPQIRLGVISEDGKSLREFPFQSTNMVEFIKQNVCIEDLTKTLSTISSENTDENITLLPPVSNPEKIICIGLNYSGHCLEQNKQPPKEPMFFSKFSTTLVGPAGNVVAHDITNKLDWEVELAVVIGKQAKLVSKEDAMNHVFGYSVAQDISARDWQKERNGGQFLIGKSMDTFCPLGPAIVHKSLIKDPHNLTLKCSVNGVLKQQGNTNELIFRIDDIISRLSESITLNPGDVILTGTPAGVGMHRSPPEYLQPGDLIESEIQYVGKLMNQVVKP